MKIVDALLANGWHSANNTVANSIIPISLDGTKNTATIMFKQHEPGLFRVMGLSEPKKAWKMSMSFLQLKSLISPNIEFDKVKDQSVLRKVEEEYREATALSYKLKSDDKKILKKLLEISLLDDNGKINKNEFSSVFEDFFSSKEKGKEKAQQLLLAGIIDFEAVTNKWEILISEDEIFDLPDNVEPKKAEE